MPNTYYVTVSNPNGRRGYLHSPDDNHPTVYTVLDFCGFDKRPEAEAAMHKAFEAFRPGNGKSVQEPNNHGLILKLCEQADGIDRDLGVIWIPPVIHHPTKRLVLFHD